MWLREIGITTRAQLEQLGVVAAYLMVEQAGYRPSLNLLWAMAAGLEGRHWTTLSAEQKQRLRAELTALREGS